MLTSWVKPFLIRALATVFEALEISLRRLISLSSIFERSINVNMNLMTRRVFGMSKIILSNWFSANRVCISIISSTRSLAARSSASLSFSSETVFSWSFMISLLFELTRDSSRTILLGVNPSSLVISSLDCILCNCLSMRHDLISRSKSLFNLSVDIFWGECSWES